MPQPQIERKFIDLKALKVSDEGPGTIEGNRAIFSEIDEGGDLIVKGFFADSIVEYLEKGFSAHSHEWAFKDAVGFPVEAYETDEGFFVKSQFHSTSDAQDIRTKAKERMEAGKTVGFSFGYSVTDKAYVEAKDFKEQLPLYVKADRLAANLIKAQKFDRIRILKKGEVMEDSIVTAPMNKMAMATGVKSIDPPVETKGLFEDCIADCEESLYFLCDKLQMAIYRAQMIDDYAETSAMPFDLATTLDVILGEFSARVRAAILDEDVQEDSGMETMANSTPFSFKGDLRSRLPFAKHAETALGAVEVFANKGAALLEIVNDLTERSKTIMELRETKAGAVYSGSNLSHMQRIHDAMGKLKKGVTAMHGDMAALIAKAKKPDGKADEAEVDVQTLRIQSMRLRSQVGRTLAHL